MYPMALFVIFFYIVNIIFICYCYISRKEQKKFIHV